MADGAVEQSSGEYGMKLQLPSARTPRATSVRGGGVPRNQLGCIAAVVVVLLVLVFSKDDDKTGREPSSASPAAVTPDVATAPSQPVEVPETSTVKPGFKERRWGDPPTGMKYVGRGDGLTKYYEPRDADCVELGGETNCSSSYHFFRKTLFAVTLEESFITRDKYRPSMLPDLESQWGRGTGSASFREWRTRDKKRGLTIATWTSAEESPNQICCRIERVRIWSERIERERLKVEADSNSSEMRQLQKEIDDYQREQQRDRDKRKM